MNIVSSFLPSDVKVDLVSSAVADGIWLKTVGGAGPLALSGTIGCLTVTMR